MDREFVYARIPEDDFTPGFFHLCIDINDGETKHEDIEFEIRNLEKAQRLLEDCQAPIPQYVAIQNTLAVLMFKLPHKKLEAKEKLEHILEECKPFSINTGHNLLFMYEELQQTGKEYEELIRTLKQKIQMFSVDESNKELMSARALCERAYFCTNHTRNCREVAEMFRKAIAEGSTQGMTETELSVWQYFLFSCNRKLFDFVCNQLKGDAINSDDVKEISELFTGMSKCFQTFYVNVQGDCEFYKSRAIIDVLLTLIVHKDVLLNLPNFELVCQSKIITDMTKGYVAAVTKASEMNMSSRDFKFLQKVAHCYLLLDHPEDAIKYSDKSLQQESELNFAASKTKMLAYSKMAKSNLHDPLLSGKFLIKAYNMAKKRYIIYPSVHAAATAAQASYECAHHTDRCPEAFDKNKNSFLEEALKLIDYAIKKSKANDKSWIIRQKAYYLSMLGRYVDSIHLLRESMKTVVGKHYTRCAVQLFKNYSWASSGLVKQPLCTMAVQDLQSIWVKLPRCDEGFNNLVSGFAKNITPRYFNTILQSLLSQNTEDSKMLLKQCCTIIINDSSQLKKKEICDQIIRQLTQK